MKKPRVWRGWGVVVDDELYYDGVDMAGEIERYFIYNRKPKSWPEMGPSDHAVCVTITEADDMLSERGK